MQGHLALTKFMEARSAVAERASLRPEPCTAEALSNDLSDLLDAALIEMAADAPPLDGGTFALVAIGGYGRRELARHSDVDVMILVDGQADQVLRMLYPLWDASLKVGHSVRTVPQAIEAAKANVETFTSLLDARFLAGDQRLFGAFLRERRAVVGKQQQWMRHELSARREEMRRSQPWQMLAVDLKTDRGGLRDLHAMHWLAAAEAIAHGTPEPPLPPALAEARELLMRTRHAVHSCVDRPTDVYRPETAAPACAWLGVEPLSYARRLYTAMRLVDAEAGAALRPADRRPRWPWKRPAPREEVPAALDDLSALRAMLRSVDGNQSLDPLGRPAWLERILPEWEVLRARPHIAPFHAHPVDVHAVRTVAEARAVIATDEFGAGTPEVAAAFGRDDEILLAALLHDIGKGHAGVEHPEAGAVIAERFAARVGLPAEEGARLAAAVRHHLLLPAVATRRDIADAEVIAETARTVGNANVLRLLYILSIADARASGPNVWNQWKAQLTRALFERVLATLEATPASSTLREETVVRALAERFPEDVVRAHLRGLEPGYLISLAPDVIGDHIALIQDAGGQAACRHDRLGEIERVTVVSPDRPGLLQDIAGTLAGFSVNVLGGAAYTRGDGVAIQVWHVADALGVGIDERRWERILAAIPAAAAGTFGIEERLADVRRSYPQPPRREDIPTVVHLDNRASRAYSVLEISAADRRGLLYEVTRALHELRVNIHLAKVDTIGPEIFDAFYIQRENGSRIEEPDEVERLERRIEDVLARLA